MTRSPRRRARAVLVGLALVGLAAVTACSSSGSGAAAPSTAPPTAPAASQASETSTVSDAVAPTSNPCGAATKAPATWKHVVWIWMENHEAGSVIGAASLLRGTLPAFCVAAGTPAVVRGWRREQQ